MAPPNGARRRWSHSELNSWLEHFKGCANNNNYHQTNQRNHHHNQTLATTAGARSRFFKMSQKLRRSRKYFTVLVYTWLIINIDSIHLQRVLGSMMASKLLSRSISNLMGSNNNMNRNNNNADQGYNNGMGHHGMSAVEAVALIHAMNGNRGGGSLPQSIVLDEVLLRQPPASLKTRVATRSSNAIRKLTEQPQELPIVRRQPISGPLREVINRQSALVPVTPRVAPVAAVAAAAAALLAAVATGLTPLAAAAAAAAAALLAILAALFPQATPNNPLIKFLIIKKTVLPFVIPIPFKKREKEVVYKYIHKPHHHHDHHHEHEHEHDHYEHKKKKYRYKKMDNLNRIMESKQETPPQHYYRAHPEEHEIADERPHYRPQHRRPPIDHYHGSLPSYRPASPHHSQLDTIQTLIHEQDKIQSAVDEFVEVPEMTPDRRQGLKIPNYLAIK